MVRQGVRREASRASLILLAVFAGATLPVPVTASTPCLPMAYSVAYASPAWTVSVISAPLASLNATWYWAPWNGSYESFLGHTGRVATQAERVTLDDGSGDGALSASDRIRVWDDVRALRNLTVAWYGNASRVGFSEGVQLADGYRYECTGGPAVWAEPIVLLGIAVGVAGVVLGVLLFRRRR